MIKSGLKILITGASSGIGEASAISLAKGNNLFLIGRDKDRLSEVVKKIRSLGGFAQYYVCDVQNENDVEMVFQDVMSSFGGLDVLFTNAGIGFFGKLEDITTEQFDCQFNTNVRGVFLFLKKFIPLFKSQNRGQIVVTSSNLGLETSGGASIYSATKHAVQAMVECLRDELKGTGVKAATINPGSVSTPWFAGRDVDRSKMLRAEDVAKAFRFIVEQSSTSNIEHILLYPGKQ